MSDILPEDAPAPRLCHLIKWPDFDGYGFNLHAERSNPGQFVGKIDLDSPAQMGGLREGDRVVEVNGVNVNNENHRQVVERIKSEPNEARLLVVDAATDEWYRARDIVVKSSQVNVVHCRVPAAMAGSLERRPPGGSGEREASEGPSSADQVSSATIHRSEAPSAKQEGLQEGARSPAPMSPDSGKGDEVARDEAPSPLTIEAEINHRPAPAGSAPKPAPPGQSAGQTDSQTAHQINGLDEACNLERDTNVNQPAPPATPSCLGYTSSSSGASSRSSRASIADSLEDRAPIPPPPPPPAPITLTKPIVAAKGDHISELLARQAAGRDKLAREAGTIEPPAARPVQQPESQQQHSVPPQTIESANDDVDDEARATTRAYMMKTPDASGSARSTPEASEPGEATNVARKSAQQQQQPAPKPEPVRHQQQQSKNTAGTAPDNYSGLNLNMTVSQMRELLASRKKVDPKKAQINIRQKYEIIQQM